LDRDGAGRDRALQPWGEAMSDVTRILESIERGDPGAAERLLPLVYDELRKLAAAKLAREAPGQTLQATALVHEAWLKLAGSTRQKWNGRAHFFGAAAEAMRRILIDQARRKGSQKGGAGHAREELDSRIELRAPAAEVLAVHESLDALAAEDHTAAEVVKLRYFVGMTVPEIGEALGLAPRTVDRYWAFARLAETGARGLIGAFRARFPPRMGDGTSAHG
jgi:RNA polymerase sigma factor (TIGR02999 family)